MQCSHPKTLKLGEVVMCKHCGALMFPPEQDLKSLDEFIEEALEITNA